MNIVVRHAESGDATGIASLYSDICRLHADALPNLFQRVDGKLAVATANAVITACTNSKDSCLLVAVDRAIIAGYALAAVEGQQSRRKRHAKIRELVVSDAYRRHGLGSELIAGVESWAKARGVRRMELTVWEFNRDALAFYDALGFSILCRSLYRDVS